MAKEEHLEFLSSLIKSLESSVAGMKTAYRDGDSVSLEKAKKLSVQIASQIGEIAK